MAEEPLPGPPTRSSGDVTQAVTKAILSAIPVVGGPAAELFAFIFAPPLERRRDEWVKTVAEAVDELREKVAEITPESLSHNDSFITAAIHASQIAMRSHQQEKLEALRNAVQNSALPSAPEDDLKLMFLELIDTLTPWHLRILKLLSNPPEWFTKDGKPWPDLMMGGLGHVIEEAFPDLKDKRDFYNLIGRELFNRGLTNIDGFGTTMSGEGLKARRLSPFGAQFLAFIEKQV